MSQTTVDTPMSLCGFGVARRAITPPVGIYHRMWGAAVHDRATGVHRPLTATVLVLRDERTTDGEQVVVALDHCLLWAREMEALIEGVCAAGAVPRQRLTISFSHTHAAGLMGLERVDLPGGELIKPYLESLPSTIVDALGAARRSAEPATITYGVGRCALAAQRDYWDEAGRQFVCGFNPEGPADDTVLVARVTAHDGRALAHVVNYACHPTSLAWENTRISPDYPGALREVVEQATGAPCVFLQGASGDLGPRDGFAADPEVADRNGRQLGYAALAAIEALPPPGTRMRYAGAVISGTTIGTWVHEPVDAERRRRASAWRWRRWTLDLPYRSDLPDPQRARAERDRWLAAERAARAAGAEPRARHCRARVEQWTRALIQVAGLPPGDAFPFPITVGRIGDAFWVAIEGEAYHRFQRALRDRFPGVPIVVIGLANGWRCAYLPARETYGRGIYPESIAVLAAGCLERLIDAVSGQIAGWLGEASGII